jgi:hypothetical protein|tara:strand:+ start:748 stop:1008 length:261 start_codon:yes stop_codon:yes gene_type:complete
MAADKDFINALADALLGTGSLATTQAGPKWYVCVRDEKGGIKKTEASSMFQAEVTVNDWLTAGWAAWMQDDEGNQVVVAKRPKELN